MNLMLTELMINCCSSTAVSLNGGEKQLVMSQRKNAIVAAAHKKLMPPNLILQNPKFDLVTWS